MKGQREDSENSRMSPDFCIWLIGWVLSRKEQRKKKRSRWDRLRLHGYNRATISGYVPDGRYRMRQHLVAQ